MLPELTLHSRWPAATDAMFSPQYSQDALILTASQLASSTGLPTLILPPPAAQHAAFHHHPAQGCLAAFSIVFLGEFGDKTFFTAALLAVRVGRTASFAGSMLALAAMSVVGVGIGSAFAAAPPEWCSGLPVGEVFGALLLLTFGLAALRKAARESAAAATRSSHGQPACTHQGIAGSRSSSSSSSSTSTSSSVLECGHPIPSSSSHSSDGGLSPQHSADAELAEAEQAVEAAASKGLLGGAHSGMTAHKRRALLRSVLEVAAVMFVAEWGDRSMLATVALGAAQDPWGVAVGATAAYAAATGLAVLGGAWAAKHVSEHTLDAISGVLFLLFAAASVVSLV